MGLFQDIGKLFQQSTASIVGKKLDVKYDTKAGSFLSKVNNTTNTIKLAIGAAVLPAVASKQQDKKVTTTAGTDATSGTSTATTNKKSMGLFDFFGTSNQVSTGTGTASAGAGTGTLSNVSSVFQNMLGGGTTTSKNSGISGTVNFGTGTSTTTNTGSGTQLALMPIIVTLGIIGLAIWGIKKLLK